MPETTSDRMRQLTAMLEKEPLDTFLLYGVGLEHKKLGNHAIALEYLDRVIALDAGYCYAYHQKGLIFEAEDNAESARAAYRTGIAAAIRKGDAHARSEIEAALQMLD